VAQGQGEVEEGVEDRGQGAKLGKLHRRLDPSARRVTNQTQADPTSRTLDVTEPNLCPYVRSHDRESRKMPILKKPHTKREPFRHRNQAQNSAPLKFRNGWRRPQN